MPARRCYYEVLEVERDSSDDQLRSAYRRLARIWHPDKNLHQMELAEETFKEIRGAYEILSDPNERAWYDAHREDILAGGDGTDQKRDAGENLWQYFNTSCYSGMHDNDGGFYKVYKTAFESIDKEEISSVPGKAPAPSFGTSTSDYAEEVRAFYNYWVNFSSERTFAWKDVYNTTQAPNRDVRRVMEKQNKKERDTARRGFNELVRRLAEFARKKDPRVMAWARDQAALKVKKEEMDAEAKKRQAEGVSALKKAAMEARQAHLDSIDLSGMDATLLMSERDLKRHKHLLKASKTEGGTGTPGQEGEQEDIDDEEEATEEFYCPACKKVFKSDKQFKNHENSKKHKDAAAKLRKELLKQEAEEDAKLGASKPSSSTTTKSKVVDDVSNSSSPLEGGATVTDDTDLEDDLYLRDLDAVRHTDDIVHTVLEEVNDDLEDDDDVLQAVDDLDKYRIHHDDTSATAKTTSRSATPALKEGQRPQEEDVKSEEDDDDDDAMLSMMANKGSNRFAFADSADDDEEDEDGDDEGAQDQPTKKPFNFADFESGLNKTSSGKSSAKNTTSPTASPSVEAAETAAGKKKRRRAAKDKKAASGPATAEAEPEPVYERGNKRAGKAKKGAARYEEDNALLCRTCNAKFPSKTALHNHLQQTKHAIAM